MLICSKLNLKFGDQIIFDDLEAAIAYDEKIGILGRNGAGKSTLLRAIAGSQQLDSGLINYDKKKTIGYLPQEVVLKSSQSVYDESFSVFDEFLSMQKKQKDLERELEQELEPSLAEKLSDQYVTILETIANFDLSAAQAQTVSILNGLGFNGKMQKQSVDTLSVGWQMRVVLAKLLLQNADFYLFDEPTNHLDLQTKEWFLEFLKQSSFGYLLVTHDRHFLETGCVKLIELERGKARRYNGNFSFYCRQKEEERERLNAAKFLQDKEIARKKETIERFRFKATKRGMVKSMEKQLDKIEIIEIEPPLPTVNFSFGDVTRTGKIVLELENISQSFGNKELFKNVSARIMRGQKVALIAPNGTGKTTLFNLIVGKIPVQRGSINNGHNVESAYFEQEQARVLTANNTVLQEVLDACPQISESKVRSFLGSFLFSGDDVEKKIHQLSGGERNRVAMVKILLQNANFLLLDEPTNHLDLYAKEVLLQALQQYSGTMVLVSHDHDFIHKVADTIIVLTPDGLEVYQGNYESYCYQKKMHNEVQHFEKKITQINSEKPEPEKKSSHEMRELKKRIGQIERSVSKLEEKRDQCAEKLAGLDYNASSYKSVVKDLELVQAELDQALQQWEELTENLEER